MIKASFVAITVLFGTIFAIIGSCFYIYTFPCTLETCTAQNCFYQQKWSTSCDIATRCDLVYDSRETPAVLVGCQDTKYDENMNVIYDRYPKTVECSVCKSGIYYKDYIPNTIIVEVMFIFAMFLYCGGFGFYIYSKKAPAYEPITDTDADCQEPYTVDDRFHES